MRCSLAFGPRYANGAATRSQKPKSPETSPQIPLFKIKKKPQRVAEGLVRVHLLFLNPREFYLYPEIFPKPRKMRYSVFHSYEVNSIFSHFRLPCSLLPAPCSLKSTGVSTSPNFKILHQPKDRRKLPNPTPINVATA
ncbi:MAG: hypothetical protein F6J94_04755 [Moorea sp. SIO1F2]|nr:MULTISPECIES: hypothetical protein [unclassified Moorena]NEO20038.1 hypothetical protein [Moorena sp. SIO4A5]NET81287.1 hypothetical protein [Moorena sp. SIO1F2]